jgi:hypothetical protein
MQDASSAYADLSVNTRQQLIYQLCEAAELEHNLCCSYLFAAFSLKSRRDEALDEQQLLAVGRWRDVLYGVAYEEMLHLALTGNLLLAIGAAPHFRRPNLPQVGTHYPPEIKMALTPFTEATLDHFVYVERPEHVDEVEGKGFESTDETLDPPVETDVVPQPQDFMTVNQLYRGIQQGFRDLAERLGERRLFIGPPAVQAGPRDLKVPGLVPVTTLDGALAAISLIIEQGEGSSGNHAESHYRRFVQMRQEYRTLKAQDPGFKPGRPVLDNPFTRAPGDARDVNLLGDAHAVEVCDLFNGAYDVMLQLLLRYFAHSDETLEERRTLVHVALGLMASVLRPLGELITTLPAGDAYPGKTAGPSFHFYRSVHLLPHKRAAWIFLHERLCELTKHCASLEHEAVDKSAMATVRAELQDLTDAVGRFTDSECIQS